MHCILPFSICTFLIGITLPLTVASSPPGVTGNLVVFDEALQNGHDCSFTGGQPGYPVRIGYTSVVHSGTYSIGVQDYLGVGFGWCASATHSIATDYPGISFWVNGGANGGENVFVTLESAAAASSVAAATLTELYGGPLPTNSWVHIQHLFSSPPFVRPSGTPDFDSVYFSVFNDTSTNFFVLDDISLLGVAIFHNSFDLCAANAVTKPGFLDLLQSSINNVTSCIPQSTNASFTSCSLPKCPGNAIGCPVTTHAGPFNGTFAAGSGNHYTSTGSADDLVIDIAYSGGSCTITASNLGLDYALDYTLQDDWVNGLAATSLDQSTLTLQGGYMLTGSSPTCETIVAAGSATLISQLETEGATGIAAIEQAATIGKSVCPLTP